MLVGRLTTLGKAWDGRLHSSLVKTTTRSLSQKQTSEKVQALCYITGHGPFFSDVAGRRREIFIPSLKQIYSAYGISKAKKPNNFIVMQINDFDTFDLKTPLIPIELEKKALKEFAEENKRHSNPKIWRENACHLNAIIEKMTSKISVSTLSYKNF